MRRIKSCLTGLLAGMLLALPVAKAQDMFIYPSKGQSPEQQKQDEAECQRWATEQSGFDPLARPTATTPPPAPEEPVGGVGRGAVRGGLGGLAIGAIAGDAGKGAAIGAVGGGLIGGIRRSDQQRREEQAQEQWAQQQATQYNQGRDAFDRAFRGCLQGRGYTVS